MRLSVLALVALAASVTLSAGCSGSALSQDQVSRLRTTYCEGIDLGTYQSEATKATAMDECIKAAEHSLHHGSTIPNP